MCGFCGFGSFCSLWRWGVFWFYLLSTGWIACIGQLWYIRNLRVQRTKILSLYRFVKSIPTCI